MQTLIRLVAAGFVFLAMACCAAAIENTALDDPSSGPQLDSGATPSKAIEADPAPAYENDGHAAATGDNRWRYRQHEGRWWYWLPSNHWVVWQDERWVDPPAESIPATPGDVSQYQSAPRYVVPAPSTARILQPRPRSWYYSGGVYDGPRYYYDEFYSPYGGSRPYSYYPVPRPYPGPGYYGRYGGYPYGYGRSGVGVSIGSGGYGSGVRIGIGF